MDYQSLHMKTVVELKKMAKLMNVRVPAGTNKSVLIELLLEADGAAAKPPASSAAKPQPVEAGAAAPETEAPKRRGRPPKAKPEPQPAGVGGAQATEAPRRAPKKAADEAPAKSAAVVQPADTASKEAIAPVAPANAELKANEATGIKPVNAVSKAGKAADVKPAGIAPKAENIADAKFANAAPRAETVRSRIREGAPRAEQRQPAAGRPDPRPTARHGAARPAQEQEPPRAVRGYVNRGAVRQPAGDARGQQGAARVASEGASRPALRPANPRYGQRPEGAAARDNPQLRRVAPETAPQPETARPQEPFETGSARGRREGYYNAEYKTSNPAVPEMLAAGECADGAGVLEIQQDGYGFLRAENCLPGPNDVYISIAQIRRFNLRMGDYVVGKTRPQREGDRYSAMMYITSVNGEPPETTANRPRFEDLVPVYPDERLRLESTNPRVRGDFSLRLVDMLAPIGKGQRGMIVSQPKAGKTTLLKMVANAITENYPEVALIVLLIDERPEEVTDMKRSIQGEVIYSTFDEEPEHHVRVSEMVLERAQRLVEMGKDVVVLMDSITRLARAYNLVITPTGRSLSGGLDPGALFKPKRFFGAARNIENGGSLTVIATALVETGSRMDDIIFEEFKGTGNMELHLDRRLSDKRVFPAVDMLKSGTRREELLLTEAELDGEMMVRRVLSGGRAQEMTEQVIDLMSKTFNNAEFFGKLRGWLGVFEKEGFTLGGK